MILLIIRFSKFVAVIISFILISVAFFFALSDERKVSTVSAQPESRELPIIMYHHITTDASKAGKYTVLVSEFENDLSSILKKTAIPLLPSLNLSTSSKANPNYRKSRL